MTRYVSISALVLFIFIAGILVGLLLPKPQFFRKLVHEQVISEAPMDLPPRHGGLKGQKESRMMQALTRRMKLQEDQITPFTEVIQSHKKQMQAIMMDSRSAARKQIDSLNTVVDAELGGILDEEQLQIWGNFRKRITRDRSPRENRPGSRKAD